MRKLILCDEVKKLVDECCSTFLISGGVEKAIKDRKDEIHKILEVQIRHDSEIVKLEQPKTLTPSQCWNLNNAASAIFSQIQEDEKKKVWCEHIHKSKYEDGWDFTCADLSVGRCDYKFCPECGKARPE